MKAFTKLFVTFAIFGFTTGLTLIQSAAAARLYIKGAPKVTFRIGPGTENKIINMLELDDAVTLVEEGETWSKVKSSEGKEGFVMKRFLTEEIPYSVKYRWMRGQRDKLKEELEQLKSAQSELSQSLSTAKRELASTKENLETTSSSYADLKAGSAKYLELKSKFEETGKELEKQSTAVKLLQEKLSLYYFTWFLAGAGVLLLGYLMGLFSKKRKKGYGNSIQL